MRSPKMSPRLNPRSPRARRQFDRHSAEGNLRSPKRNGAGAKGCWGTIMDQEGPVYVDHNDPNYDSDLDGNGFVLEEINLTQLRKEIQEKNNAQQIEKDYQIHSLVDDHADGDGSGSSGTGGGSNSHLGEGVHSESGDSANDVTHAESQMKIDQKTVHHQ